MNVSAQTYRSNIVSLLVFIASLCLAPAYAQEDRLPDVPDTTNIVLGESLRAGHFSDDWRIIANLRDASQKKYLDALDTEPQFYLAQAYIAIGLANEAIEVYTNIAKREKKGSSADTARLEVAKLSIDQGHFEQARSAIKNIGRGLNKTQKTEHKLVQALLFLHDKQAKKAIKSVPKMKHNSTWATYHRYNIGVTLLSHHKNTRGAVILGELGGLDIEDHPPLQALKDQANLALGFSLTQLGKTKQARKYLSRISLGTPASNQALLGMGWAYSAEGTQERALVYWTELSSRPIASTYYYESLLAVPFGFARAKAYNQAAEAYEMAIVQLEEDRRSLDKLIPEIQEGKLSNLLNANADSEFDWIKQWQENQDSLLAYFLPLLLESPPYQSLINEHRALLMLKFRYKDIRADFKRLETHAQISHMQADIDQVLQSYTQAGTELDQAIAKSLETLNSSAITIFEQHKANLHNYARQARFGLAQVIEQATFGQ